MMEWMDQRPAANVFAGVLNRCAWMRDAFPSQPHHVACFKTAPTFVDAIAEMFAPLLAGVPSVVFSKQLVSKPKQLVMALQQHRITQLVAVPSLLRALLPYLTVSCKGETVPCL